MPLVAQDAPALLSRQPQAPKESLLIGPGDMLSIHVLNEPELNQDLRVTDAGNIPVVLLGDVHVASLTPSDAAAVLEKQYIAKQFLLHPRVSITVEQFATQTVSVLGDVKNVGTYPATTGRPITEVLAQAGGLSDTADRHIVIQRHGEPGSSTFFVSNKAGALFTDQPLVYPGDTVFVPRAGTVYMLGDVGKPGAYVMANDHSQLTALQALALSGSAKDTAKPSHARLLRHTSDGVHEQQLALDDMRKGRIPDMPLQADDVIYVPYSYLKNVAIQLPAILASTASAAVYVIR